MASLRFVALCATLSTSAGVSNIADIRSCRADDELACTSTAGQVMLQVKSSKSAVLKTHVVECTAVGDDPWTGGRFVKCCGGSKIKLGIWKKGGRRSWHFRCVAVDDSQCTTDDEDPWRTGKLIECCSGFEKQLVKSPTGHWHYKCLVEGAASSEDASAAPAARDESSTSADSQGTTTPWETTSPSADSVTSQTQPPTGAPVGVSGQSESEDAFVSKVLEWNVHYKNRDHRGIAGVVAENEVDVVGLCELTGSMGDMARALSKASGRDFRIQPGRESWKGFGTDIFYDNGKWKALEGGVSSAECSGSRSGKRAVNWVVLQDRESGRELVVGGTHISYCSKGCDSVHECELKEMYRKLEKMREKYSAPVVWMGDMNRKMDSRIMRNVLKGKVGSMRTFPVDDLVQTDSHTYYTGGSAIDHILGESGKFHIQGGGRTEQGERGRKLKGADHFPVFAEVHVLK
jgi:endonuclease/exonuclease/phosphatase family metal-dependent hydrolase